jgi:hypothetical protein
VQTDGRRVSETDRRTDITKLKVTFCNSTKAPKRVSEGAKSYSLLRLCRFLEGKLGKIRHKVRNK